MITTHHLTKKFNGVTAVEDLSLDVHEGEVLGLLGPNGAGKTTTVRMLACLIAPTSGEATVCDYRVGQDDEAIRRSIGILTEVPGLYESLSAKKNLEVYAQLYGVSNVSAQVEKYLRLLDLWDRRNEPAGTFSKGMKQKLAIARALVHEPKVLFLDEPTSGLDPQMTKIVRDFIEELHAQGRTILLCTHNLDEAERLCDRIAVIRSRLVALDRPAALRTRLFGQHTIVRLRHVDEHILSAVRALDFVSQVHVTDNSLIVALDDPETHNPALVRQLVAAGADVLYVTEQEHSLEEIYLRLMKEGQQP
jgi:ABC-2 type transport system ATP-binding protein